MRTVLELDLSNNIINHICEDTLIFLQKGKLKIFNLANNNITNLSSKISNILSLQSMQLSGNKFICNCDMTWMIEFLAKRTVTGKRVVEDYDKIVCHSGIMTGKYIYKLNPQQMGCYPHQLSMGEKLTIGVLGAVIIIIVIVIIAIGRRWNEVKWLLYLHFNILDKSDRNEDLSGKTFDAFLSYR